MWIFADAVYAHLPSGARVARDRHRNQIGHRCAANEETTRALRQPEQLFKPIEHGALDVDRTVIPTTTIGVHGCGQHFRYDSAGQPRAVHPSEKPRMRVAGAVW